MTATIIMNKQITQWLKLVEEDILSIKSTGKPKIHYKNSTGSRICLYTVCTPSCSLCITWSTIWRILCCPLRCCARKNVLETNDCTKFTDGALSDCMENIDEKASVYSLLNTGAFEHVRVSEMIKNPGHVRDFVIKALRAGENAVSPGNYNDIRQMYKLVDMFRNIIQILGYDQDEENQRAPLSYYMTISDTIQSISKMGNNVSGRE